MACERAPDEMQLSKFGRSTAIGFSFNKALSLPLSLSFFVWRGTHRLPARPLAFLPGCLVAVTQPAVSQCRKHEWCCCAAVQVLSPGTTALERDRAHCFVCARPRHGLAG